MNIPKRSSNSKKTGKQKDPQNQKKSSGSESLKKQLLFSVQSFMMYIHASEQCSTISSNFAAQVREKIQLFLEKIQKSEDVSTELFDSFNDIIEKTNLNLAPFPEETQYPHFFGNNLDIQVKSQILAFQHFLHQEVKGKSLDLKVETPFFEDAFTLWLGVSKRSLTPMKGMSELNTLIQKLNTKLAKEERYPLPDANAYDEEPYDRKS